MAVRRLGLIGHSGAGKTACLDALGINRQAADMDEALGLKLSQSEDEAVRALDRALKWLESRDTPKVVTVRNDEKMLYEMAKAKLSRPHSFRRFALVYLQNPKPQLELHLTARPEEAAKYTVANYDRFHSDLYSRLADRTIKCSDKTIETIVGEVNDLASQLIKENV